MDNLENKLDDNTWRLYRAKVISNQDPQNFGRIKVTIPDTMYDYNQNDGIWARSANCMFGGSNVNMNGQNNKYAGSSYIPIVGQYVWCFFENGNHNLVFYLGTINLDDQPITLENTQGSEPWNKWVLFRSPNGRSVVISDDSSDARVMFTGLKRNINETTTLKNNQTGLYIDESTSANDGKTWLADWKGNFIYIDSTENNMYVTTLNQITTYVKQSMIQINDSSITNVVGSNTMIQMTDSSISSVVGSSMIQISPSQILLQVGSSIIQMTSGSINITSSGPVNVTGNPANFNSGGSASGGSAPPVPSVPNIQET